MCFKDFIIFLSQKIQFYSTTLASFFPSIYCDNNASLQKNEDDKIQRNRKRTLFAIPEN